MTDYTKIAIPSMVRTPMFESDGKTMTKQWQKFFTDFNRIFGEPLTTLAANRLVATDSVGIFITISDLTTWIAGSTDKIAVTDDGDGTLTISLPGSIKLDDATASRLLATDANKKTVSIANLSSWVAGTSNQVTVANDGDGTITLSLPQSIDTSADVEFDSITLDDLVANRLVVSGANKKLVSDDIASWIAGTAKQITVTDNGDGTVTLSLAASSSTVGIGGHYSETFAGVGSSTEITDFYCAPKDQIDDFTTVAFSGRVSNDTAGIVTTATLRAYNGSVWSSLGTITVTGIGTAINKSSYVTIPASTELLSFIIDVDGASTGQLSGPTLYFQ